MFEQYWENYKLGKTHEVYRSRNMKNVALYATDKVSANDEELDVIIPDKGRLITKISAKWFKLTENIVPNAVLATETNELSPSLQNSYFEGRTTEMVALKMIPIEAIVRGYITGSMWAKYARGERKICGIELPDGLIEAQKLSRPLFTPTTKAPRGEHDEEVDFEQLVEVIRGAGFDEPLELAEQMREYSLKLYSFCRDYAAKQSIILADTKFEFGVDENGVLRLADELCTPDSSRFWLMRGYESGHGQRQLSTWLIRDWLRTAMATKTNDKIEVPRELLIRARLEYDFLYDMLFPHNNAVS